MNMAKISDFIKTDDFKNEKHVPVIELPAGAKANEEFEVRVSVGKEIAHPNTTEHFIQWIKLYFHPEGANFIYEIGKAEFNSHGATAKGPNTQNLHSNPSAIFNVKLDMPGTFVAESYCNVHGLWESSKELKL
jgi:superoxide reductase